MKYALITKLLAKQKYLILATVIAFFAGIALLHPGLPPTHDGEYHIIRFYEFDKVLRDGNWYPRWAPDLNFGYGEPLFTYVYPLPNFAASFFHLFGLSFIDSLKGEMFAATLLGGIFFYLFSKEFWGEKGACISSAFYSFSPYHFVDMYVRGSVGEVWALGLFSVFLWAYTKLIKTNAKIFFVICVISLTLIIFSHNILALMFFCFALCYILFGILYSQKKSSLFLYSLLILLFSLGFTAIFWMPALLQKSYVEGLQIYNLQKNFPDLFQLFFPSWGTGFFDNNLSDQMSVQIGVANLVAVVVSVVMLFKLQKGLALQKYALIFFLLFFVITFFLLLPQSFWIWKTFPLLSYFQFPWRLLSLMILICSFLAGSFFSTKRSWIWIVIFLGVLLLTTYDYAHPAFYHMRTDQHYITRSNFIDGTNSPGNVFRTIWTPVFSERAQQTATIQKGEGSLQLQKKTATRYIFATSIQSPSDISFAITYFPGWTATIQNRPIMVKNINGLISIAFPKGNGILTLRYSNTKIETVAEWISILTLFLFALLLLGSLRKSPKNS